MTYNTDCILRGVDLPPLKPLYNEPDEQVDSPILPTICAGEVVAKVVLALLATASGGIVATSPKFGHLIQQLFR